MCSSDLAPPNPSPGILGALESAGHFTTLISAINAAGMASTFSGPGPFTLLAPTDEAFAALPAGTVADLLKPENKTRLQSILNYHAVSGKRSSANLQLLTKLTSLSFLSLNVVLRDGSLFINTAPVLRPDIAATNGVIHGIGQVLSPPPVPETRPALDVLGSDGRFTVFLLALKAAGYEGLLQTNKNLTAFVPTDAAFALLEIGRAHV